jgi:DNA polymerase-1
MKTPDFEFPVKNGKAQYEQYKQLSALGAEMQTAGWAVDREACQEHLKEATETHAKYLGMFAELSKLEGLEKDCQSQQVRNFFWVDLGVPVVSRDKKTKKPKLDGPALVEYAHEHPDQHVRKCAAALYALRRNFKKMGYMNEYLEASAKDGRVHPSWNPTGTKTGRWSCSSPNMQQVSSRSPEFDFQDGAGPVPLLKGYKDCFIADEGFVLLDADYAALELYLQTYIASEPKLIEYIRQGKDLHIINARVMMGPRVVPKDANKKTHKQAREVGKLAYGFAYNATENVTQVAKQMRQKINTINEEVAKIMRKAYFREYPAFPRWQQWTIKEINEKGYIETPLMNRRLYLPANPRGYNQALNGQNQITGADRVNLAALDLRPKLAWEAGEQLRGQIHDSLVTQCRPERVEAVAPLLVASMTFPVWINGVEALFVAEPGVGYNWADMIDVKDWLAGKRP